MKNDAFKMKLKPGFEAEYKKRHDEIWPELSEVLAEAGVSDYSIFLDPETLTLFAAWKLADDNTTADLPNHPVVVATFDQHFQNSDPDINTNTIANFSPATGANTKLVVAASWESAADGVSEATYANLPMSEAVSSDLGRQASIWYLDLDGSPPASGDVVVTFNGATDSRIGVLSLVNAAAGAPSITVADTATTAVTLPNVVPNSLSVGVYTENKVTGSPLPVSDFAETLYVGDSGSSFGNAGYEPETVAGPKTYNWTADNNASAVVAANFAAPPAPPPEMVDDDEDAMDDDWEVQVFGSLGASDGSGDSDGDGISDFDESRWGTSPVDAESRFRFTGISPDAITWESVQGIRYRVLSTTSIDSPSWGIEGSNIPGSPPENSFPITIDGPREFFTVETE